jgi:DNA-binding response OmpR family regulator
MYNDMGMIDMYRIMIIDDEPSIRSLLCAYLQNNGYETVEADCGCDAIHKLQTDPVDLMVVDIMMPDMDGFMLTRRLREDEYGFPILMLTAKATPADRRRGFTAGADDYMVKPVNLSELTCRIRVLLQKAHLKSHKQISIGNLVLDALIVSDDKHATQLSDKEFSLLFKLLNYPGKIYTAREILKDIWSLESGMDEEALETYINQLKEKTAEVSAFTITAIRGLGYKALVMTA